MYSMMIMSKRSSWLVEEVVVVVVEVSSHVKEAVAEDL
jgi:hypothetical protein